MKTLSLFLYLTGTVLCILTIFSDPFTEKSMLIGIFNIVAANYVLQAGKVKS